MIRCWRRAFSDANGPTPLTTSPLWGAAYAEDRKLWVSASESYWLRITSLDAELSQLLLALEATAASRADLTWGSVRSSNLDESQRCAPLGASLSVRCLARDGAREASLLPASRHTLFCLGDGVSLTGAHAIIPRTAFGVRLAADAVECVCSIVDDV